MGRSVTLDISENTLHRAEEIAQQTGRPLESILIEWVERGALNANATYALLAHEHHIYTPLGGEDTAQALQKYLRSKDDEASR